MYNLISSLPFKDTYHSMDINTFGNKSDQFQFPVAENIERSHHRSYHMLEPVDAFSRL